MKASKGFTLIEFIIAVMIILIICTVGFNFFMGVSGKTTETAEATARNYANKLYPNWTSVRVACANMDSDGDGYVRCTIVGDTPNGDTITEAVECGVLLSNQCVPFKPALTVYKQ